METSMREFEEVNEWEGPDRGKWFPYGFVLGLGISCLCWAGAIWLVTTIV